MIQHYCTYIYQWNQIYGISAAMIFQMKDVLHCFLLFDYVQQMSKLMEIYFLLFSNCKHHQRSCMTDELPQNTEDVNSVTNHRPDICQFTMVWQKWQKTECVLSFTIAMNLTMVHVQIYQRFILQAVERPNAARSCMVNFVMHPPHQAQTHHTVWSKEKNKHCNYNTQYKLWTHLITALYQFKILKVCAIDLIL